MQSVLTPDELSIFNFAIGVGAVNTPSAEEIERTLQDLRPIQGSALLIGGLAVIHYGYVRSTKDIDILYAHADGTILKRLKKDFKMVLKAKNGWHHLEHRKTGVRLELIPEGGLTTYGFIPGPKLAGGENGFISLYGLVWLKLVSGRAKDVADLAELAKRRMEEMSALKDRLPPENREKFSEVLAQARKEMENDPSRLPDNFTPDPDADSVTEEPAAYAKRKSPARRRAAAKI